jgi:DNA-binding PadR family transcriptional regulator
MENRYSLDVAILLLLYAIPTHAADLERQIAEFGYVWSRSGGIHLHLKRLAHEGLVSSAWNVPGNEQPRLIYSITQAGIAYLQRMTISS